MQPSYGSGDTVGNWLLREYYSKMLPRLKRQTLIVFTTAAMPNKTPSVGSNSRVVEFAQSTWTNPSIAQQTMVKELSCCMNSGMKLLGNQAPPTALIARMRNVPRPVATAEVGEMAARNMPNATDAVAAARQMRRRLPKLVVMSIPKRNRPATKSVVSWTSPISMKERYLLQRMWVRSTGAESRRW